MKIELGVFLFWYFQVPNTIYHLLHVTTNRKIRIVDTSNGCFIQFFTTLVTLLWWCNSGAQISLTRFGSSHVYINLITRTALFRLLLLSFSSSTHLFFMLYVCQVTVTVAVRTIRANRNFLHSIPQSVAVARPRTNTFQLQNERRAVELHYNHQHHI